MFIELRTYKDGIGVMVSTMPGKSPQVELTPAVIDLIENHGYEWGFQTVQQNLYVKVSMSALSEGVPEGFPNRLNEDENPLTWAEYAHGVYDDDGERVVDDDGNTVLVVGFWPDSQPSRPDYPPENEVMLWATEFGLAAFKEGWDIVFQM